jgi:hypothetical protein
MTRGRLNLTQLVTSALSIPWLVACFASHGGEEPVASEPPASSEAGPCSECALDEVCLEPCDGSGTRCVPRPAKVCDAPDCECYASDPCDAILTTTAACVRVDPAPTSLERPAVIHCACAGPPASCQDHLRSRVYGDCDFSETCDAQIEGIPCCTRFGHCEDGVFVENVACDDDCAQTCDLISNRRDCEGFGCLWDGRSCSSS